MNTWSAYPSNHKHVGFTGKHWPYFNNLPTQNTELKV